MVRAEETPCWQGSSHPLPQYNLSFAPQEPPQEHLNPGPSVGYCLLQAEASSDGRSLCLTSCSWLCFASVENHEVENVALVSTMCVCLHV